MKQEFRRDCTLAVYGPSAHSRAFGHRCFEHWKCTRASSVTIGILSRRSASFSACVLLSRAFASALLRSHRARRFAHLAKYNVARWPFTARARKTLFDSKTKQAPQMWGLFRFGIRQCPTLPGVRPWLLCVHWTPPWPHLAKYNVARWLVMAQEKTQSMGNEK